MNGYFGQRAADHELPIGAINMTPLIDVFLVLLVIVAVPRSENLLAFSMPFCGKIGHVPAVETVHVDFDGTLTWNGDLLGDRAALEGKLAAVDKAHTEVHLSAHKMAAYKVVAGVMAAARRAGVTDLAVITAE